MIMRKVLSVLILISCTAFAIALFYFRPLLGDDVVYQFMNGAAHYMDDATVSQEQIKTLPQSIANSHYFYMNWSGRFYHNTFQSLISVFGKGLISVFVGAIFALFILSILAVAFSDWKKVLDHPLTMLALYMFLIFFYFSAHYNFMWIMIVTYILPAALILTYLYLIDKFSDDSPRSLLFLILFNGLGFLCGIGHEVLGAMLAVMLLGKCITMVLVQRKISFWNYVTLHIGFIIGYGICFFAPGNFKRADSSHSKEFDLNYLERLIESIQKHLSSLYPSEFLDHFGLTKTIYIALIFLIVCGSAAYIIRKKRLKMFMTENLFLMFGLASSPFLWAFAPYIGGWSMGLWGAVFYIFFIRVVIATQLEKLTELVYKRHLNIFACIILFLLLMIQNFGWFSSFIRTSVAWDKSINQAKDEGYEMVYVPKFPEQQILFPSEINNSSQYERDYYIRYYGIKIIPE